MVRTTITTSHRWIRTLALACCTTPLAAVTHAAELPRVNVTNVRRVFHNGEHNAFTDLIRWQGNI